MDSRINKTKQNKTKLLRRCRIGSKLLMPKAMLGRLQRYVVQRHSINVAKDYYPPKFAPEKVI